MGRKGMEEWIQEESKHLSDHIKTLDGRKFPRLKSQSLPTLKRRCCLPAKPFDPTFLLSCTVSNVICCLVFGERFSYDDKTFLHLLRVIAEILRFNSSFWGQVSV